MRALSIRLLSAVCGILSLGLIPAPRLQAQVNEPFVSAKLKFLSLSANIKGVDIYVSPEKRVGIQAAASYISLPVSYNGPRQIVFVKGSPADEENAQPQPAAPKRPPLPEEILGTVTLNPSGGEYLVLMSGSAETKLDVMALPFSANEVPLGSCLVWNVSSRALGISLGGDRAVLTPKQRRLFQPSAMLSNEYFDIRVFDEYEGAPRALAGGPHLLKENTRQLIFVSDRMLGQAPVRIRVIEELPETFAKAETAAGR